MIVLNLKSVGGCVFRRAKLNIFVLDTNIKCCAQYHVDKHIVKMVLETTQLLNNSIFINNKQAILPYKITHLNHPATQWASTNKANFRWLNQLGLALCQEYTYRYNRRHKCQDILEYFSASEFKIPEGELTPFIQCMPDQYRQADPVLAYREYYRKEKRDFAKWTKRPNPEWWF